MCSSFTRAAVALLFVFGLLFAQDACAQLTKTPFDWVNEWANITPSQNSVKDSIVKGMERCAGPSVKPNDIKVYSMDLNKDGLADYMVDVSAVAKDLKPTCDDKPCVGAECYLWNFVKRDRGRTQIHILKKDSDPACPATAAANTSCISYCPATEAQCPALFRDVYYLVWNGRAEEWNVFEPNALPQGHSLVPNPSNGRVLSLTLNERAGLCNIDELAQSNGKCVKFFQWDASLLYLRDIWRPIVTSTGSWPQKDEYNLNRWNHDTVQEGKGVEMGEGYGFRLDAGARFAINTKIGKEDLCPVSCQGDKPDDNAEDCKEVVTHKTVQECKEVDDFGRAPVGDVDPATGEKPHTHQECTTKDVEEKKVYCTPKSFGRHIVQKGDTCFQPCYKDFAYTCVDVENKADENYFIPNGSKDGGDSEDFSTFYNNAPPKVEIKSCERRYTSWRGNATAANWLNSLAKGSGLTSDVCSLITDIPCDSSVVVSLTRECETSLGTYLDCGECNADTNINAADRALTCSQSVTCYGAACRPKCAPGTVDDGHGHCVKPCEMTNTCPPECVPNWHVTSYGNCSKTCGGGTQDVNSSDGCGHTSVTQQPCNTQTCPKECVPNWHITGYGKCSKDCGGGTQDVNSEDGCGNNKTTQQSCNTNECPKSCTPNWHVTGYGNCSKTCGGGLRDVYQDDGCGNKQTTNESCNTQECPICHPVWHVISYGTCNITPVDNGEGGTYTPICGPGLQAVNSADGCGHTSSTTQNCNVDCPTTTPSGDGGGGDGGGGDGGDCIDPASMVLLPDSTLKPIETFKVGDVVMAFKVDHPEKLFPAKVTRIGTTHMPSVTINGHLTASRNHVILTQNRGRVLVDSLQVKDVLIKADGTSETIKKIEEAKDLQLLYDLYFDDADGYVAQGYLVLSETSTQADTLPKIPDTKVPDAKAATDGKAPDAQQAK